jgi:hypothetical protein
MLLSAYGAAVMLALRLPDLFCTPVMAGGHAVLALALDAKARALQHAARRRGSGPGSAHCVTASRAASRQSIHP